MNERIIKAEKKVNQLQGRVGSLIEEKSNLLKKIKTLEDNNLTLQDKLVSLHATTSSPQMHIPTNESDDVVQNNLERSDKILDNVVVSEDNVLPNSIQSMQSKENTSTEFQTTQQDDEEQGSGISNTQPTTVPVYDFVMLCDSNRKFLNIHKLCSTRNSKMLACSTTKKAIEILNYRKFTVNKGLIINTGVNDADHMSKEEIIDNQVHLVDIATKMFPEKKVILSGITPRNDDLDHVVAEANRGIHERIKNLPNVQHVYNGNLRENRFFHDVKHLDKRLGIPKLAKNIKTELHFAFKSRQRQDDTRTTKSDQTQQTLNPPTPPSPSMNNPSTDVQPGINTTKPITTDTIQQQLQNMTNLLNHFIQSNININQQQYQRVMSEEGGSSSQHALQLINIHNHDFSQC